VTDRLALQREALRTALQLRRSLSIPRHGPVNVYDVAVAHGVEIQFVDLRSLEGMFYRGPDPKIILPCLRHRPRGRVTFSCAHELGHFELGHGTRVDKYLENGQRMKPKTDEEIAADTFATSLLMPRPAVLDRFACRGWDLESATPLQLFALAGELDVGYSTLIRHLCYGLELVDRNWLNERERTTPKALRRFITGDPTTKRVVLVDAHWPNVPIDLEVSDSLAATAIWEAPRGDWAHDKGVHGDWRLISPRRPGIYQFDIGGASRLVRVARTGYCGRFRYRHLEDAEDT
jgi:hypothetical protein